MVDMEVRAFGTTQDDAAAAAMMSPRVSPRPGALPPYAAGAVERLFEAARRPIAVVVAPAGYGKSALLRAFATMCDSAVLLDLAGGEPTFRGAVRDLCEALRGIAPGARLSFASAYARATERGDRATALAVWLARYLEGRDVTIVVDSVDRLGEEARLFSEFAEVLAGRGAFAPRLVVAARDTTDMPVPRWLAADLIAMPVSEADLRWTVADARAAANGFGLTVSDHVLERTLRAANGRAFAALYALQIGEMPPRGLDPGLALLHALTPDERTYVLETCLLRSLDPDVLAAAGLPLHPLLEGQSGLGKLIVNWDGDGHRYDEGLRSRAEQTLRTDLGSHQCVAERTVKALEAVGRVREALDIARNAQLTDLVHRLLCEHGLRLEDRGDVDAVDAALELLPAELDDAVLLLLRATRESRLGRTDTSEAWFRHAIARAQSRVVAAEAAYRLAREIVRRDRVDAVELLEPYADDTTLGDDQRSSILSVLAEAYLIAQRPDDARATLERALACCERADLATRAHVYTRASYVELYGGDHDRARRYATIGASIAEEASLYVVATGAYSVLYNLAYDAGGPSECLEHLERLGNCAVRSGNLDFHLYAIVAAYELHVERGDVASIERLENDLRAFDVNYGAALALEGLVPSRALFAGWAGAFDAAYEILAPSGAQQAGLERAALRWAEIALYAAAAGMRDKSAEALREFDDAIARDDSLSPRAMRAGIVARLASALLGESDRTGFAIELPPRLNALSTAVDVVIRRRRGSATGEELLAAFDDLEHFELHGMAKLLAALPAVSG
jgi:ATP/maltotriose-dependent transcriptional regulator MalT